ncbi:MAG TPA: M43 family zinc metalloprotease, partial [Candidatus Acidoferrum sp.]|nr:M43 family zinc metalloprotease [Candidatus Acidoferrum sp.]
MKQFSAVVASLFVATFLPALAAPPTLPNTEFCGTTHYWERTPEGAAYKTRMDLTGTCPTNGPCDFSPNRDVKIPSSATPFKIVKLRFQIFANNDGSNVAGTSTEVSNQVALLNADYASSRIYFVYTARTNNSSLYRNCASNSEPAMMVAFAESPLQQINVFVTAYTGFNNCGIATFPWQNSSLTSTGGLMLQDFSIAPARFGAAGSFIECFSHEVGHMFGLWHTFRGVTEVAACQNCREIVGRNTTDGDLAGDLCADTPPDPGFTSINAPCSFPNTNDSCNAQAFSTNVVLLGNFMSYYLGCYNSFTPQQRGRMHCWAENKLNSWLITDSILPVVAVTTPTNGASFTSLAAISGWATDNYFVQSVGVALKEVDPSGGTGRWWNGTNWQATVFSLPTTLTGTNWTVAPGIALPPLNSGISYQITATAVDEQFNGSAASITVSKPIEVLAWDPGTTHLGTQVKNAPHALGGPFIFRITTLNTSVGVWRSALNVNTNEANLYLRFNSPPTTASYNYTSSRAGSDGFCLAQGPQFAPAQDWYYLLQTTAGAAWNLVSG